MPAGLPVPVGASLMAESETARSLPATPLIPTTRTPYSRPPGKRCRQPLRDSSDRTSCAAGRLRVSASRTSTGLARAAAPKGSSRPSDIGRRSDGGALPADADSEDLGSHGVRARGPHTATPEREPGQHVCAALASAGCDDIFRVTLRFLELSRAVYILLRSIPGIAGCTLMHDPFVCRNQTILVP